MSWVFSKRCRQALKTGKIKVSIPTVVRIRLMKKFDSYNEFYHLTTESGWNYTTSDIERVNERIFSEHGIKTHQVYSTVEEGKVLETDDFQSFIEKGRFPSFVFDATELFYTELDENRKQHFQSDFNAIMDESGLAWRMADGKIFPVDSAYIEEEILRRTHTLLQSNKFHGALQEFEKARTEFINEDFKGAIQNANAALESTMKGILGVQKKKPGELLRGISDCGIIPEHFPDFSKFFESNLLVSVSKMRNEMAGHGQGKEIREVPRSIAEFSIHLSGVLINFLIQRHLEASGEPKK